MKRLSTIFRISLTLVSLTACLLLTASAIGLVPNDWNIIMRGRSALCETIAINVSAMAQREDREAIELTLRALCDRNEEIRSIGVRQADGELMFQTADHDRLWREETGAASTETQVFVPIMSGASQWGAVEVSFLPIRPAGFWGALLHPVCLLTAFMSSASALAFYFYLRRVLQQLNPNRVVPQRVRAALDSLAEGLLLLDGKERIVHANAAFTETFACRPDDLIGQQASNLEWLPRKAKAGGAAEDTPPWLDVLRDGQSRRGHMLKTTDPQQTKSRTFMVNACPIQDDRGVNRGVITSFEDITPLEEKKSQLVEMLLQLQHSSEKIKEQNRQLEEMAVRDPLTGCHNRRYLFEKFEPLWQQARQQRSTISAVMVDVDHFKSVNDTHGHSVGDLVLREVAAALRNSCRPDDVVARYGGEEFCLVMPGADLSDARAAAERIRAAIAALDLQILSVTASLGVSSQTLGASGPDELLEQADKALYLAKRSGRNRVVTFDEVPEDLELAAPQSREKESKPAPASNIPFAAVTALIATLSYRDSSTATHSRRVADWCVALGEKRMSKADCHTLEVAALMHDIGKVGVPDHILLKPGPLTREEWQVMRKHDRIGSEIIRSSFACEELSRIVEQHRLHYTRSEAPAGTELPLGARILAICDAYDAMVTDRVFRPGRPAEEAFAELRRCAGTQFDPELVEAFIEVARVRNRSAAPRPAVPKETALHIGLQMERLAVALDQRDLEGLQLLASRLQRTAEKDGVREIELKSAELELLISQDAELADILRSAAGLLETCRATQASLLEGAPATRVEELAEAALA